MEETEKRRPKPATVLVIVLAALILAETAGLLILSGRCRRLDAMGHITAAAETAEDVEALLEKGKPAVVAFGADYCPMCVNYLPYLKELYTEYGDRVTVRYIDTVANPEIRKVYNIELIPSTLFFTPEGEPLRLSADSELELTLSDETVEERKYISDDILLAPPEDLHLNDQFEYGVFREGGMAYTKFVGILDLVELRSLVQELE